MNNIIKPALVIVAAMLSGTAAAAAGGIEVNHLGTANTLVRVSGDARYLMLPVQESNDDARVNVLVDGRLDRTIYVRLAKSKVDYSVPLDLAPYRGHNVALDIVTSQNRSNVREAKDDACWSAFSLADTVSTANTEKFRPAYHHTPLYGWMNDPNGMFYRDGVWHLYYQWNPYGSKWQNMTWGHSSSTDLVHWQHHPAAIEPDGLGTIFSGSAAIDTAGSAGAGAGAVVALYTSAGTSQMQSLAWSNDGGKTFSIYPGNPVLPLESEARDPNMWWNPATRSWTMILAHPLEHEMLIFSSPDLKEWKQLSSFGKGLGAQGGVWECPDLFELPVAGTGERKWVVICNINPGGPFGGSATQYFTGSFDGKVFTPDTDADGNVPTKWLDFGKDNYAIVSWSDAPDSRRTIIGWMSNWQYAAEVPTQQFRSANTLPREVGLFRGADGQVYASTVPSPEIDALRGPATVSVGRAKTGARGRRYALPTDNDGICEIDLSLAAGRARSVTLELSNPAGERVEMTYDPAGATFSFDRTASGAVDFSRDFPAVTTAPTFSADGHLALRIFIDRSSIEVFGNEGRFAMTNLVFPSQPYTQLTVKAADGDATISDLKIFPIKP